MNSRVYIIAELSANHNHDFDIALKTIEAMKDSGADAVKFQTFTADSLSIDINNEYFGPLKEGLWKGKRPYELFREAAMPWEWQKGLSEYAKSIGLDWLSTPFDPAAVDYLENLQIPAYKIASLEITDIPLIEYVASKGKPVIISTGVANEQDIEAALIACRSKGNENISLLKCTSQYPAPIEAANLNTIPDMKERFGVSVGLSDHSFGSIVPIVAVSLGAEIIEKHFILNRSLGGPDSGFSMEPQEFKQMVEDVRNTEKALGEVSYSITEKDRLRRRSLFIVKDIKKGEKISQENVRSVRPGHGLHPAYLKEITGRKAKKDLYRGNPLKMDDLE
jgi:pseudaminic acid synthase